MAFKFTLDVVLRVREGLEERELRELEKIQLGIAKVRRQIEELQSEISKAIETKQRELGSGLAATQLHEFCALESMMNHRKNALLSSLNALYAKFQSQLEIYKQARRSREALSELRSQQKKIHQEKSALRDQKLIDEIFGSRRNR